MVWTIKKGPPKIPARIAGKTPSYGLLGVSGGLLGVKKGNLVYNRSVVAATVAATTVDLLTQLPFFGARRPEGARSEGFQKVPAPFSEGRSGLPFSILEIKGFPASF